MTALNDRAGLEILDISNPIHPQRVGDGSATDTFDVAVANSNAFVAAGWDGLVTLEMLPFFKSITRTPAGLDLSWEGFGSATLQRATLLVNADWQELPGLTSTNCVTLPIPSGSEFFRLLKP